MSTPPRSNVTKEVGGGSNNRSESHTGRKRGRTESGDIMNDNPLTPLFVEGGGQHRGSYRSSSSSGIEKIHHGESTPLTQKIDPLPRSASRQSSSPKPSPPSRSPSSSRGLYSPVLSNDPASRSSSRTSSPGTGNRALPPLDRSASGGSDFDPSNNRRRSRHRSSTRRSSSSSSLDRSSSLTQNARRAFSFILGGNDDVFDEEDEDSINYTQGGFRGNWYGVWKRRLLILTVASIVLTIISRSVFSLKEEHENNNGDGGEISASVEDTSSATTPETETADDFVNVKQSCGEFFEPDPIMKLKNISTVENLKYGAVASDNVICSNLGVSILRDLNGNAVDAAVATTLCLGVVNPASSGIGGGGFILIHSDAESHGARVGQDNYVSPPFDDKRVKATSESMMRSPPSGSDENTDSSGKTKDDENNATRKAFSPAPDNSSTTQQDKEREKKKVTEFIDCRETAPAAATYNMYEKLPPSSSIDGGLAIAIPAELRGLELAHSRHGFLPWKDVVKPAMELARDGFPVTPYVAYDIEINEDKIRKFPDLMDVLSKDRDGKTLLKLGDTMKRPELAKTLELVMEQGASAIYTGNIAKQIVKDIQDAGGIITESDLANYRPVVRDPLVSRDVFGYTMIGSPPPSSGGGAIIGAARFLAGYATPLSSAADTLSKHRIVEAMKHVFAIRMSLSDPAFYTNVTSDAINDMICGQYMEKLRQKTRDDSVLPMSHYGGTKWAQLNDGEGQGELSDAHEGDRRRATVRNRPEDDEQQYRRQMRRFGYLEDHGTTHLSVVDKDRNAVAITSTVNTYFGSGVTSPSTGIIFNNQMDDFATPGRPNYFGLKPSPSNYIAPGKRPLSSISPTIILRNKERGKVNDSDSNDNNEALGDLLMVMGASGGPKIITSLLQIFVNYALNGMPLFESVANPRVHDQLLYHGQAATTYDQDPLLQGPTLEITPRTKAALSSRGHRLLPVDYTGTAQAVSVDLETNRLTAVSDIRKYGVPAGY